MNLRVLSECMSCTMYTNIQEGEKMVSDPVSYGIMEDIEPTMWMLGMEPESSAR